MIKNNFKVGFSTLEIIISLFIFISIISSTLFLTFESQNSVIKSKIFQEVVFKLENNLIKNKSASLNDWNQIESFEIEEDFFSEIQEVSLLYDYSKIVKQKVSSLDFKNLNPAETVSIISDWSKSIGGDTCSKLISQFENFSIVSDFDLGFAGASDLDVVRGSAYVSFNSSKQSDPDFLILDVKEKNNPQIISQLNTGPGTNSLQAAGRYVFLANDSMANQLQIIDIFDIDNPVLVKQYRLIGNSSTTIPHRIFYKDKKVFLGMKKHDIGEEFHVIDVSDIYFPNELKSKELDTQINDIKIKNGFIFLAVPNPRSLRILDKESLEEVFSYETGGNPKHGGQKLYIWGNLLTLSRSVGLVNSSYPELFIFDISKPDETLFLDSESIGGSIRSVLMNEGQILVANLKNGEGLRVFSISDDGLLSETGVLDNFSFRPIAMDCDGETVYVLVEGETNRLIILENYDE